MDSTDFSVLKTCIDWLQSGKRVALATVAETWGSSPRPVGSWLAIRDDGHVVGSVSGGCVEDDLIARVRSEIFTKVKPEFVIYGVSKEEAARFGLPCGGTLRIVVEPNPSLAGLQQLTERIKANREHHVVAAHPHEARARIGRRHREPVTDVQVAAGIGQHG